MVTFTILWPSCQDAWRRYHCLHTGSRWVLVYILPPPGSSGVLHEALDTRELSYPFSVQPQIDFLKQMPSAVLSFYA